MPNDLKATLTTWVSATLAQDETWQCLTGKVRISLDTTPAIGAMSLENGMLLEPLMAIELNSGSVVRYRRAGTSAVSIARIAR